jgi:hypothetical protein
VERRISVPTFVMLTRIAPQALTDPAGVGEGRGVGRRTAGASPRIAGSAAAS